MWTEHQPTAQILQRAVLLARESGAVLRSQLDRVQGPTVAAVDFKVINAALILFPNGGAW